ncbi:MAG: tRNA pseudouridine(38-40) synthase TruA [Clostridia bacterium]|nr:tRNA pseudouridine(38-40) synthase TruA [Clostridia bacterium]
MSKLLVKLKYNGSAYVGWQVQKNGKSVQSCVQDAVEKLYGVRADVTGCSRTDSGVHANGYCFCFTPPYEVEPFKAVAALNFALPDDMGVYDCIKVPDDFHPRYSAVAKEYIYKIYGGRPRNPFLNGLAYHYIGELDTDAMNDAAKEFVGRHDFRSFMANGSKITDTFRTVYYCSVMKADDCVQIRICADGFLYKMVRIIVGTLLAVNEQKIDKNQISYIISARDRSAAGKTAPPQGLYLNRVFYDIKEVENADAGI